MHLRVSLPDEYIASGFEQLASILISSSQLALLTRRIMTGYEWYNLQHTRLERHDFEAVFCKSYSLEPWFL